jgi:hypothetical protein
VFNLSFAIFVQEREGVITMEMFGKVRRMFVRRVMTHREYDEWCKLYRKGEV